MLQLQIIEGLSEFGLLTCSEKEIPLPEVINVSDKLRKGIRYLKFIPLDELDVFDKNEPSQGYDWVLDLKKGKVYPYDQPESNQ